MTYDPKKISYKDLVEIFWKQIDPTDDEGQFVDRGSSYTTAIFYHTAEQKKIAEASKAALDKSGKFDKPIVTPIIKFTTFYPAEDYHQDYAVNHPIKYGFYFKGSGRKDFIQDTWGDEVMSTKNLKETLTPLQYKVTQEDGTEPAYKNEYWDNKKDGIYVDLVSGEALFSSTDKYDSKTGWPSFTKPLVEENVVLKKDFKIIIPRTEVRSKTGNSHLGHLFKDGPEPTGLRYCINSAALKFVPKKDLKKEGYEQYLSLFAS